MNKNIYKKTFPTFISIVILLSLWQLCAKKINSVLILPSFVQVLAVCKKLVLDSVFWKAFFHTTMRCLTSFVISFIIGLSLGVAGGKSSFIKKMLDVPLCIIRTTPVIAIILICLYWLSSSSLPIFISVLMNLPVIITSVIQGFSNVDKNLLNMAQVYNFSFYKKLIYIELPSCFSNIKASLISVYGLCWKVVVASEVLCLPKNALGSLLHINQTHLETDAVMAITILFVIFSMMIERLVKFGVECLCPKI